MAQDATKIFAGPAKTIELSADGVTYVDIGFSSENVNIDWEPDKIPILDGNEFQSSGLGKISIELIQTGQTVIAAVKAYRIAKAYVKITALDDKEYVVSGIYLSYTMKRSYKPGEAHALLVTGQRRTINPDDFCPFPT